MLSEGLATHVYASHACGSLANGPHADWHRKHWEENFRLIQSWVGAQTQPADTPSSEVGIDSVVLVVNDEAAIAITLSQILARHGFPTVWLTDPCSAAELLKKLPLGLLITNLDMPGIDGVTLAALARQAHASCPVLLFSARGAECRAAERLLVCGGGVHFQAKPVAVDALLHRVRTLCVSSGAAPSAITLNRVHENQQSMSGLP